MKCKWHLCNNTLSGRQRRFCSSSCKNKYHVAQRRKTLKANAVAYKGGRCALCGYNECLDALTFHHLEGKDFGIAYRGYTRSWATVQAELDKCVLLCQNCHAEVHAGLHDVAALLSNG